MHAYVCGVKRCVHAVYIICSACRYIMKILKTCMNIAIIIYIAICMVDFLTHALIRNSTHLNNAALDRMQCMRVCAFIVYHESSNIAMV